ncbi:hypothetical protein TNCV_621641 [Trichonephila clavipes]|nr:hypothetical protein TNCV_621641 [Trichonephila clavipes]
MGVTRVEQRSYIKIAVLRWKNAMEYHSELVDALENNALPYRTVARWVLDESRSFFRVHTGYFSNIPRCIKAEFIASWACSQSSVVSSSQR